MVNKTGQKCQSYVDLIRQVEKAPPNPKALNHRDSNGVWHSISTQEFLHDVKMIALGLREMGLKHGDRVAIYAPSSPSWTIVDLAIVLAGGITVPIFTTISEENFIYEVRQTRIRFIFVEGTDQWNLFKHYEDYFQMAIGLGDEIPFHDKIKNLQSVIEAGTNLDKKAPHLFEEMKNAVKADDVSAIIYTSGSTGVPKGVELTQKNMTSEVEFGEFSWNSKTDRYLSVLPLEHVFGHCFNLWMIFHSVSVYYSNDHKHLGEVCSQVKPTMIAVVPRLLEKAYGKMVEKVHSSSFLKRQIGKWAFHLAHRDKSLARTLLYPLLDLLVYTKLRAALGGKLRMLISGGAPINPRLHHFFQVIGIPIYQGWGLTEACPITTTTPIHNKVGTVGRVLPGQQIKFSPEGEILVKGSLVMKGYYDDPVRTAATIDPDGFMHTGDKGKLDDEGYLTIIGRIKELYKSSTGEYIAPVPIEQAICRHPLIDMALVIAEGRKFASCLLFPNMEVVDRLKKKQQADGLSYPVFLTSPYVRTEINSLLQEVNKHLNHPEQIRDYRFVLDPLTIKGGDLTPSMKIRREPVIKKYRELIDTMYQKEVEE